MVEEKKGLHRAYLVWGGVCLMMAGGMGLVLNVVGNFFVPITMALFGDMKMIASVTLIMTVYSYVMLVWLPFAGRLFDKIDGRILFGVSGILVAISIVLNAFWTNIWGFYISGAIWGLAGPILWLVGPSTLINNWFAPHKAGRMLGIASAFTGFGAFVWSPLISGVVTSAGYQTGFLVEAAIAAVLLIPAPLILFRVHPEDMGLTPCGSDDAAGIAAFEAKTATQATGGMAPTAALKTVAFYAIFIAACLISLGGGYKSTMPTFTASFMADAATAASVGAWMISAAAIGNIVGKIFLGFLSDKLGLLASMLIFCVLVVIGFILFLVAKDVTACLLVGGFCVGTADALMSVGLPLVTRTAFGLKNYAKIYSFLNMGIAFLGGLGATVVALLATAGGWNLPYICGAVAYAAVCLCLIYALTSAKKLKAKWED